MRGAYTQLLNWSIYITDEQQSYHMAIPFSVHRLAQKARNENVFGNSKLHYIVNGYILISSIKRGLQKQVSKNYVEFTRQSFNRHVEFSMRRNHPMR